MATRKQKVNFAIRRFRGFWDRFKQSKRGMLGTIILVFFLCLAIFAPLIATYEPIDPQMGVGEYPPSPTRGIKIAEDLCKPAWYKYLPWIERGQTESTEKFYNVIEYHPELGLTLQMFAREGATYALDDSLRLQYRVSSIEKVEATFPNGTTRELSHTSEWYVELSRPREIRLKQVYPDGTNFKVSYVTGADLVENIEVVPANLFSSSESFSDWTWQTNSSGLVDVSYNSEKGFSFTSGEEVNRGCLQISYATGGTIPSEAAEVTVSKPFTYPYSAPPVSFSIHSSILVEGTSQITVNFLFFREGETNPFLLMSHLQHASTTYIHYNDKSENPTIADNVGLNPPQDRIFANPGNYTFSIQIVFPSKESNAKVYLDNVNCIIYGNIFGVMGTDNGLPFPRDIFSLLAYGSRVSLFVGVLTAIFSTIIGLFVGLVAGYMGGVVDEGAMRLADLLLVLPTLPLFIVLVVAMRAVAGMVSMWNIIIILTLFGWMSFSRSIRSMVLSIRERTFIEAAKAAGAGKLHIINRHIIPNVFSLVYITLAMAVPGAIVVEASLSWLGLGDPNVASWGKILYDFNVSGVVISKGLLEYWFWIFPACGAIALLATAFILIGYALDEILNPRLRERR